MTTDQRKSWTRQVLDKAPPQRSTRVDHLRGGRSLCQSYVCSAVPDPPPRFAERRGLFCCLRHAEGGGSLSLTASRGRRLAGQDRKGRRPMSGVKLIAPEQRKFEQIGGEAGDIRIGRDVGGDISKTFGAGIAVFE